MLVYGLGNAFTRIMSDSHCTMVLITGLPGAGKTSLAKELELASAYCRITTEEIRGRLFQDDLNFDDRDLTDQERSFVYRTVSILADYLLGAGISILVDGVFRSRNERREMEQIARKHNARFQGVHLSCAEGTIIDRLRSRKAMGTMSPSGIAGYFKVKPTFEPVSSDYICIDTTMAINYNEVSCALLR